MIECAQISAYNLLFAKYFFSELTTSRVYKHTVKQVKNELTSREIVTFDKHFSSSIVMADNSLDNR